MPMNVVIYSETEAQWVGEASLEKGLGETAVGGFQALLRPPAGLPPDHYVLRLPNGERWAVETLSKPGRRLGMWGGRVTVVSHQPPPVEL